MTDTEAAPGIPVPHRGPVAKISGVSGDPGAVPAQGRITSYNVCYTKLLRWPLCHGKVLPPFRLDIYMEFLHRVIAATAGVALVVLSHRRFRSYNFV